MERAAIVATLVCSAAVAAFTMPAFGAPPEKGTATDSTTSLYDAATALPSYNLGVTPLEIGPIDVSPYKTVRVTISATSSESCNYNYAWQGDSHIFFDGVPFGSFATPKFFAYSMTATSMVFDTPGRSLSLKMFGYGAPHHQPGCLVRIQILGRGN